jgi:SAM-dependent methyltransferase
VGEATLELLEEFPAYGDFIWERVSSLAEIRGDVLEMGCGIGSISRRLLGSSLVRSLDAVDIDPEYLSRVSREIPDPRLRTICSSAEAFEPREDSYDLVVSINVLEHVRDDLAALRGFARALRQEGVCLLLVPAHPWLFSSLDSGLSHHRRYTREGLRSLAARAGLETRSLFHWNPLGALGWWLNGKLLRRPHLSRGQVAAYSRFCITLSRLLDRLNPFPLGISLVGSFVRAPGRS